MKLRLLLAAIMLGWFGCSTTPGPISGRRYLDRTPQPSDPRLVAIRDADSYRFNKYILVQQFPDPRPITPGLPSRVAFELLGKATAMQVDVWSNPPVEVARMEGENVVIEWRTCAYWNLARRRTDDLIETVDITVHFVKLTRSRSEIAFVGTPVRRDADKGWRVEKTEFRPGVVNLKSPSAKHR